MSATPYLSPSERFYRGMITREEARRLVLANASRSRRVTSSPEFNKLVKVIGILLIPFIFLANCVGSRRH